MRDPWFYTLQPAWLRRALLVLAYPFAVLLFGIAAAAFVVLCVLYYAVMRLRQVRDICSIKGLIKGIKEDIVEAFLEQRADCARIWRGPTP